MNTCTTHLYILQLPATDNPGSGRENLPWQEKIQSQYILFLVVWFETRHIKVPIMGKNFPV